MDKRRGLNVDAETLVRDYLGRLETAARPLPASRRAELAGEVRQHIEMALDEAGARDEVTVRNVLERLGPPDEIIAAEEASGGAAPGSPSIGTLPPTVRNSAWGGVEITAILLLTVGAVLLPIIGPLIGLVFVWASAMWTNRQKLVATGIVVVVMALPIVLLLAVRTGHL
jgi:uncharacterized membrane protein